MQKIYVTTPIKLVKSNGRVGYDQQHTDQFNCAYQYFIFKKIHPELNWVNWSCNHKVHVVAVMDGKTQEHANAHVHKPQLVLCLSITNNRRNMNNHPA